MHAIAFANRILVGCPEFFLSSECDRYRLMAFSHSYLIDGPSTDWPIKHCVFSISMWHFQRAGILWWKSQVSQWFQISIVQAGLDSWFLKTGKAPTTSSKDEHVSPLGGFLLFFRGYTPKSSILTALTGFSIINHPHLNLWTPSLIHIKRLTRKKHHDSEDDAVEESVYWWFIYIKL